MSREKKTIFTRIITVVFMIFITVLLISSFYFSSNSLLFTPGIITVLCIMVVLVLSETFDNMSIGKIIDIKRESERKDNEIKLIKDENRGLRENLINMATVVKNNQTQQNHSYYGLPTDFLKLIGVKESENKDEDSEEDTQVESVKDNLEIEEAYVLRQYVLRYFKHKSLNEYIQRVNRNNDVIYRAEFTSAFEGIDPIMDRKVIFEGYFSNDYGETFVEVRVNSMSLINFTDRLYLMLSKILHYKNARQINARLVLILVNIPKCELIHSSGRNDAQKFYKIFAPAIRNELLKIEEINISLEEVEACIENKS